jgi:hypothetical protein
MSAIPYIVCTAHPDYKRPCVCVKETQTTIESLESDLTDAYFNALVDEVYFNYDQLTQENLDKFFETYYDEHYMDNAPISISYFMNGEWCYFNQPTIDVLSKKYAKWRTRYH